MLVIKIVLTLFLTRITSVLKLIDRRVFSPLMLHNLKDVLHVYSTLHHQKWLEIISKNCCL
jgi:hypothetical protein